ncbi:MAG: hypothetical protein HXL71_04350 [Dialister invisus]|nr:hypothetical protein [Dialister invisus]
MVKRSEPCKVCCRGVESGKKIKAISCELSAVSCQLKVMNDGGRSGITRSDDEGSLP